MDSWLKIGLIAAAVWVATKVAAALSLKLSPGAISVDGTNLNIQLIVTNTSTFPISYDNFTGSVYINNQNAGAVYDNTAQKIAANAQTVLNLTFVPLPGTIISNIISEIQSGGASQLIQLKGTLTAENIPLPISTTYVTPNYTGVVSTVKNLLANIGL
jgi:hypothetical protein